MSNCVNCSFTVKYHRNNEDGSHTQYRMTDFGTEDEAKLFVDGKSKDLIEGEWLEIIDNSW